MRSLASSLKPTRAPRRATATTDSRFRWSTLVSTTPTFSPRLRHCIVARGPLPRTAASEAGRRAARAEAGQLLFGRPHRSQRESQNVQVLRHFALEGHRFAGSRVVVRTLLGNQ